MMNILFYGFWACQPEKETDPALDKFNDPPGVPQVSISPSSPYTSDDLEVSISLEASDPEGDAISYQYRWYVDDEIQGMQGGATVDSVETRKWEVWQVSVRAFDGKTLGPAASAQVTIANTRPQVIDFNFFPVEPNRETGISVTAQAMDADEDLSSFVYRWYVNGQLVIESEEDSLSGAELLRGDIIEVGALPFDGEEFGVEVVSDPIQIRNSPPEITDLLISPSAPVLNDLVNCDTTVIDPDGAEIIDMEVSWTVDGVELGTGLVLNLAEQPLLTGDILHCDVRATDSEGAISSMVSTSVVIQNSPPLLEELVVSPESPHSSDDLSCLPLTYSDLDHNTEITFSYRWEITTDSGVVIDPLLEESMLPAGRFSRGDSIRCAATPNDGLVDGTRIWSDSVEIGNSRPSVSDVQIQPSSPSLDDVQVECIYQGFTDADFDQDQSIIEWIHDGAVIGEGPLLIFQHTNLSKNDSLFCQVRPFDGFEEGQAISTSEVLENSLPVVSFLSLTPQQPSISDDLTAIANSYDADGDWVYHTYDWIIDGFSTGHNSSSFPSYWLYEGAEITVRVTPDDWDEFGVTAESAPIYVVNSPPSEPVVSMVPDFPDVLADLYCRIDMPSLDIEGDIISYEFSWEVNGVAYSGPFESTQNPNDTIPHTETTAFDEWMCMVTPFDGHNHGSAGTAWVDINPECISVNLDGCMDYGHADNADTIIYGTEFTIELWFFVDTATYDAQEDIWVHENGPSMGFETPSVPCAYDSDYDCYPFNVRLSETGDVLQSEIEFDYWNHVALVYDQGQAELYINGELETAQTGVTGPDLSTLGSVIRIADYLPCDNFTGMVDEVRISSVARYDNSFYPETWLETDGATMAHWRFNQASGNTAPDVSGNGYDFIFEDGATWIDSCPYDEW